MTTYRVISDTEVAVDAPLTQQLMQALKDNDTATAEGSAGAPRIQHVALEGCDGTPSAGNIIIAETSKGYVDDNASACEIKTRVAGEFKFTAHIVNVGIGSDVNTRVTIQMKKQSSGVTTNIGSSGQADNGEVATVAYTGTFAAGDRVYVDVNENNSLVGGVVTLKCSVADDNAIYGVQAYSVLT